MAFGLLRLLAAEGYTGCVTLTAETGAVGGGLDITVLGLAQADEAGKAKKFVKQVGQITFSGKYARADQTILYITERCVFQLIDGKMTLIEIAPGIDLERDIPAYMDFTPAIAPDLKTMDPAIFQESWGGLGDYLEQNQK